MSEPMALEKMTETRAQLLGYLTSTRVPYIAIHDKKGKLKTGNQPGDLDLVGVNKDGKLLIAECKGYGTGEDYQNWLTISSIQFFEQTIQNCIKNIKTISDSIWEHKFKKKGHKTDCLWIIFPGYFYPTSNPSRFYRKDRNLSPLESELKKKSEIIWETKDASQRKNDEIELLKIASVHFSKQFNTEIELIPIHQLIISLIPSIRADMEIRRKRYPDTSMEMIRWLVRAVQSKAIAGNDFTDPLLL